MTYYERIGEEFGFGTEVDGKLLWFDGDCESMLARVRRDALDDAAEAAHKCAVAASTEDGRQAVAWCLKQIRALIGVERT